MNSEKTQIARRYITAPTRWLLEHVDFAYKTVLHHGEGKAFPDTRALTEAGAQVRSYEPSSSDAFTATWPVDNFFDIGVSNYVFNTLTMHDRKSAFLDMLNCCNRCLISVRTDRVSGMPHADGVITQRGTFQSQLGAGQWVDYFRRVSPEWASVSLLHNGGHFAIIDVSR